MEALRRGRRLHHRAFLLQPFSEEVLIPGAPPVHPDALSPPLLGPLTTLGLLEANDNNWIEAKEVGGSLHLLTQTNLTGIICFVHLI